ncbi:MAG: hypothetical protein JXR27_11070 [Paludibacteraceae bacterium]|nr:hypothetical protein [Paludibacteraceae bacterium]
MKRIIFFLTMLFVLISCDDSATDSASLNKYVNRWLYDNMSMLYYWNEKLPAYKSSTDSPDLYFKTLIYKGDRFSAIFESYQDILNSLHGVSEADPGFEYQLYRESDSNNNVVGVVLYNKPGTAASSVLKRGDFFRKINGTQITIDNYSGLLAAFTNSTASFTLSLAERAGEQWSEKSNVTIQKSMNYQENPVFLDTVYTVENKKIGYLVYHFFTNDNGDQSLKYDLVLNEVFGHFKEQRINELVVDLRYNSGGMMSSAVHLGSMLVPDLSADKVYSYTEYNKNFTDYFSSAEYKEEYSDNPFIDNFVTNIAVQKIPATDIPVQNVGNQLSRIYFLTGRRTASASEMVINSLKPYITCVLVGDVTVGKNVGSTLVNDEDNKKNDWAFMPIILQYFNKDWKSDFTNGFVPDFSVSDTYNYSLGDLRESLLNKAVREITGNPSFAPSTTRPRPELNKPIDAKPFGRLIVSKPEIDSFIKH